MKGLLDLALRGPAGLLRQGSPAISPTAHYTGHVWARNGVGPDELRTCEGRLLYHSLQPAMTVSGILGGPTVEGMLLARHQVIDQLLTEAIESGEVSQVLEVASGMSPRGHRFATRYGDRITYVEADLPDMAERKRAALANLALPGTHRVVAMDALRAAGPTSLPDFAGELDDRRGLAVLTEGLLNYLPPEAVRDLWARIAGVLSSFPQELYLADLHLGPDSMLEEAFRLGLSVFVRSRVHTHFDGSAEAGQALRDAGFGTRSVRSAAEALDGLPAANDPGAERIHIVRARTTQAHLGAPV